MRSVRCAALAEQSRIARTGNHGPIDRGHAGGRGKTYGHTLHQPVREIDSKRLQDDAVGGCGIWKAPRHGRRCRLKASRVSPTHKNVSKGKPFVGPRLRRSPLPVPAEKLRPRCYTLHSSRTLPHPHRLEAVGRVAEWRLADALVDAQSRPLLDDRRPSGLADAGRSIVAHVRSYGVRRPAPLEPALHPEYPGGSFRE